MTCPWLRFLGGGAGTYLVQGIKEVTGLRKKMLKLYSLIFILLFKILCLHICFIIYHILV